MKTSRMDRLATIAVLIGLATLFVLPEAALSQSPADVVAAAVQRMEHAAGARMEATRSSMTGLVTFMSSSAPVPLSLSASVATAEARAREFLNVHGGAFGVTDTADVSLFRSHGPDLVGTEHVRFKQLSGGVPITAGELTVHLRGSGVVAVNARTLAFEAKINTTPTVSAAEALAVAQAIITKQFAVVDAKFSTPRLEIFNRGMLEPLRAPTHLAWFIEATKLDLRQFIWIDAHSGIRLLDFSQLTDALNRSVYTANGGSALPGTLVRSEGGPATADNDVNKAYEFSGDTYNYYLGQHGRDSYDGAGAALKSTVHYCPDNNGCDYQNAFWNGTQMVYGNGFSAADDVDAHELTHAVTEYTANLFYYMQSGALNESYSDIFGETVDLLNGAGTDTAGVRWLMGEDVPVIGAIRNMMDPTAFGNPGKMSDAAQFVCEMPGGDGGGVHSNSGVPNHAYALMVDGGSYNGFTITGIGLTKAGKIQYRALSTYLLSGSDFLDNYNALKQSCADLIGTAGITALDCTQVGKALDAVEMASAWPCAPQQAAVPAFCPAGQAPANLFFDNLENPASGNWAISTLTGTGHWYYPVSSNPFGLGPFATSGVQNFWGYNESVVGSSVIGMTSSVGIPAGARLQFNHSYGFENDGGSTYDGGVVEYSTNAGTTWVDAGNLISAGAAYGGTISSCCSNPLGGRSGFVKSSFGYTASQLDLATLAGQSVRFRFRMGTDFTIDDYGWFIDDIRIYRCVTTPVASRDFNGDSKADILLRHSSGLFYTWFLNGTSIIGSGSPSGAAPEWTFQAAGDFNGDGKADILLRHSSGLFYTWLLNGNSIISHGSPGGPGNDWTLQGVGDFNGDGKADILLRHTSGIFYIWFMDGANITGSGSPSGAGPDWEFKAAADFNGDGKADILLRHTSGIYYIWFLNGASIVGSGSPSGAGPEWTFQAAGDFNGDGKADMLLRHSSGLFYTWLLNGASIIGHGAPAGPGFDWSFKGVADFSGDGKADILLQHSSGVVYIWLMDGIAIVGSGSPSGLSGGWSIQ